MICNTKLKFRRPLRFILFFLLPIVLLVACQIPIPTPTETSSPSESKATVQVGYLPLLSAYPLYTALEEGYFKDEGLKVEMRTIKSGPEGNEALAANNIDVAFSILPSLIVARSKGVPNDLVSIFGASIDSSEIKDHRMMLPKDSKISTLEDLRGKKIAVVGYPGRTSDVLELLDYLERNGIKENDIRLVGISHADQVAALESGTIDAAAGAEPYVTLGLLEDRVKIFPVRGGYYYNRDEATEVTTYLARKSWIKSNPNVAEKFISALNKGLEKSKDRDWLINQGLPSFNEEASTAITFVKLTPEQASEMHLPEVVASPTDKSLKYVADQLIRHGPIKESPQDFLDMIYRSSEAN